MLMKPHEILSALGFDVPEQGIEINEHDAFLHEESLRLLGKTISIDRIDNDELISLHDGLAGLVAAYRGEDATQASEDTPERLKSMIRVNCSSTYKFRFK